MPSLACPKGDRASLTTAPLLYHKSRLSTSDSTHEKVALIVPNASNRLVVGQNTSSFCRLYRRDDESHRRSSPLRCLFVPGGRNVGTGNDSSLGFKTRPPGMGRLGKSSKPSRIFSQFTRGPTWLCSELCSLLVNSRLHAAYSARRRRQWFVASV
jgi:hypothetical protein